MAEYLNLPIAPADTAFGLMADFEVDNHPNKVSLIAGAYRNENGDPWVLPSVKEVRLKPIHPVKQGITGMTGKESSH